MDLKAETIGLAVMLELPMVIVDVQRAGPSTGMPTKTEQADLLLALYGRHGESPLPIVAAATPAHCFDAAIEAVRIAVTLPDAGDPALRHVPRQLVRAVEAPGRRRACPTIDPAFATGPNAGRASSCPYLRDEKLARPWAIPGTPGLQHRIGGLEKEDGTGDISYEPENHARMTAAAGGEGRGDRRRHPAARGRRPRRGRGAAGARLGLDLRRRSARPRGASANAGTQGRDRAPAST